MSKLRQYKCVCGSVLDGKPAYTEHRLTCEGLEERIYQEIDRIADKLGRTPTARDYRDMASKELPSQSWICARFGNWSDILEAVGMEADRRGGRYAGDIEPVEFTWVNPIDDLPRQGMTARKVDTRQETVITADGSRMVRTVEVYQL